MLSGQPRRADGAAPREAEFHASTRILLVLAAIAAIGGGWWALLSINDVGMGIAYSVLWTILVLVAARILLAVGFGYNRLTAHRGEVSKPRSVDTASALAELADLRDRQLISAEEYEAKRAKAIDQL